MPRTLDPTSSKCSVCGFEAAHSFSLKRHESTHLKCRPCRLSFACSSEASEHRAVCQKLTSKLCALCSVQCGSTEEIEEHLVVRHNIELEKKTLQFSDEEEFREWKKQIEVSQKSNFVTVATYSSSNKRVLYLACHRSGIVKVKSDETRLRHLKKQGSHKMNAFCPARMHVTVHNDGSASVNFVATHVGHDFSLGRIHLDRQYRAELAARMLQNIPLDSILDQEREIVKNPSEEGDESFEVKRSNLLNRKDLHNIARDFHVSKVAVRDKKDTIKRNKCKHVDKVALEFNLKAVRSTNPSALREESRGIPQHRENDASFKEMGTAMPKESCEPYGHSLEDVKAKMMEIMDTATNDDQIAALYETVKQVEVLLKSLAAKPSTSEEISPLPQSAANFQKTLSPPKGFGTKESKKRKRSDTLSAPSQKVKKKIAFNL